MSVVDDRDQSEGVRLIPNEPASTPASEPEDAAVASRAGPSEGTEAVDDDDQERPSLTLVAPERAEELSPSRPGAGEPAAGTDEPATAGEGHGAPVDVADQPAVEPERPGLDEQPTDAPASAEVVTDQSADEALATAPGLIGEPASGGQPAGEPVADEAATAEPATEDAADSGRVDDGEAKPAVDDVFARIRAGRAAKMAHANEVLAADAADAPPVTTPGDEALEATGHTAAPPEPEGPAALVTAFDQRDATVESHERALTKALKRALADEQNELLDALRTARGVPQLDTLLPNVEDHEARYRTAGEPALTAVAAAGAGVDDAVDIGEVLGSIGHEVVGGLRPRLEHALVEAAGDEAAANEALSAVYREWKTSRAEALARHHVLAAYAEGSFAAADEGPVQWVVDPEAGCSPDCADNALAGPTAKGEPFPTGQTHPPAHAGCRCLVLPAAN